ncbi:MAG: pilus assembly protein [Oligoflexia bacterium]|nr:pilus assembly protein [Oligoflexia bacterium]
MSWLARHRVRRRGRRSGAAAVEFALTAPVLLIMAGGVGDWGFFLARQASVVYAVRDGARAGALTPATGDPAAVARVRTAASLDDNGLGSQSYEITAETTPTAYGTMVTVAATVHYSPLLGIVPIPGTAYAEASMRWEEL